MLCLASAIGCRGQTITVRLINGKDGKPFTPSMGRTGLFSGKLKRVALDAGNVCVSPANRVPGAFIGPGWERGFLLAPLDDDGRATFHIPKAPLPPVLSLNLIPAAMPCNLRPACFPTERVLRTGVATDDDRCGGEKISVQFKPKPGEIILFVRRHTFWDSLAGY